jgi:hypothetical protein
MKLFYRKFEEMIQSRNGGQVRRHVVYFERKGCKMIKRLQTCRRVREERILQMSIAFRGLEICVQ